LETQLKPDISEKAEITLNYLPKRKEFKYGTAFNFFDSGREESDVSRRRGLTPR